MTDVDDVLRRELQRVPVSLPERDVVRRRVALTATRRRRVRRGIAGGAAVGIVLVALGLLTSADRSSTRVDTISPDVHETTVTTDPAPRGTSGTTATPVPTTPSNATPGADRRAEAPSGSPDPATPQGAAPGEGCEVEGYDERGINLKPDGSPGGLSGAEPPSCSYTADQPGGYVAGGKWRVEIRRGPYTIQASSAAGDPTCAPVGFIQPGDSVTLTVLGGIETSDAPGFVRAGPDRSC